jgi:hypothetical protein
MKWYSILLNKKSWIWRGLIAPRNMWHVFIAQVGISLFWSPNVLNANREAIIGTNKSRIESIIIKEYE